MFDNLSERRFSKFFTALIVLSMISTTVSADDSASAIEVPEYELDRSWPELPLPHKWALGWIDGIYVDARDHVWVLSSPDLLGDWVTGAALTPAGANCCVPAPAVIEFDQEGNVVNSWGGPGEGYDWPTQEHGIFVDYKGNVWISGNSSGRNGEPADGMVLKFTGDGEFLMQIGGRGPSKGSLDTTQLAAAAAVAVDPEANEVYIADGYVNHRVIVFDADTGEFKRQWGAYGEPPTDHDLPRYDPDAPPSKQFDLVHCVRISNDGLVYVCDRKNNRLQVFERDGTFVEEFFYETDTTVSGSVGSVSFWPDTRQSMMIINDSANFLTRLVRRSDGKVLSSFGHYGTYAGEYDRNHQAAFDSRGNLYISEDNRVQRFKIANGVQVKAGE